MADKEVIIYSTPTCPYCKMAKQFFTDNNVTFSDFDVSNDMAKQQEMISKSGQLAVPVIDVGGEIVVGFNEPKLRELLGK